MFPGGPSERRAHEFCALAVTLVVVGLYGGGLSFPMPFFRSAGIAIRGASVGTLDELQEVVALGREGKVPPIPLDVRPLDAAPEAMADCAPVTSVAA